MSKIGRTHMDACEFGQHLAVLETGKREKEFSFSKNFSRLASGKPPQIQQIQGQLLIVVIN